MRLSVSAFAVSIRIGTIEVSRNDFASWKRSPTTETFPPGDLEGAPDAFDHGTVRIVHAIEFDGRRVGSMALQGDLGPVYGRLQRMLAVLLAGWSAGVALSWLLARRLETSISGPIVELSRTAKRVCDEDDYSVRAAIHSDDEVGELAEAFNRIMMGWLTSKH